MKIECSIKTPQYKNGVVWYYHNQAGWFDEDTLLFTPYNYELGNHNVQFQNFAQFENIRK